MKKILLAILVSMTLGATAQTSRPAGNRVEVTTDSKNGSLIYKGQLTIADLEKEESFSWYRKGVARYNPDKEAITFLKYYLPKYTLVAFLGTWCEDSHTVIPKMVKVLQEANATGSLVMHGVDREKWSGNGESKKFGVTRVPTMILLKDGREVGRITEYPNESVETDLAWLIDRDVKGQSAARR